MPLRGLLGTVPPDAFQVTPDAPAAAEEESWASLAVFTQLSLLVITFIVGQALERRRVTWIGEAGFALVLGVAVGMVVRTFAVSETFTKWISFKVEFFFIALLPPIIFDAGFSLKTKPFFSNIGAIAAFAFVGTAISCFVVAAIVWAAGWAGICTPLTFLEATLFGAIVSATDPVTVLAIFQRLGADEDLYALVFGESVLNDAVAIVLYSTLTIFLDKPASLAAGLGAVITFLVVFVGSMVVGISFALLASLLVRTKYFRSPHMPLEPCLVILFAYSSYMLADGLDLSGIVAILFCGMVMAHYTRPNLSQISRDRTAAFSKMLATLAETFVFVYTGATLFLEEQAWGKGLTWAFLGVALVALAASRAANIYPCAALTNALRPPEAAIPKSHCFMLWFSGLRGAMAFALSLQAAADLPNTAGRVILTSTFFIVLITVLVNGGFCAYLVEALGLQGEHGLPAAVSMRYRPGQLGEDESSELLRSSPPSPGHHSARSPPPVTLYADAVPGTRVMAGAIGGSTGSLHRSAASGGSGTGMDGDGGSPASNGHSRVPSSEQGFLTKGLSRVRELSREGGVLGALHSLDERYLQPVFAPQASAEEEELAAELVVLSDGDGHADAAAQGSGSRAAVPRRPPRADSPAKPPAP